MQDNINEMAHELMNSPRFTAYAKILQQSGAMGEIQLTVRNKIKTRKLSIPNLINPLMILAYKAGKAYCKQRSEIEKEIRERQEAWKKETKIQAKIETKKTRSSKGPPPTSY